MCVSCDWVEVRCCVGMSLLLFLDVVRYSVASFTNSSSSNVRCEGRRSSTVSRFTDLYDSLSNDSN